MTRLIVVSNRVALPRDRSARAGGLAVGVLSALKRSGGIWFGWSGETNEQSDPQPKVMKSGGITYATIDFTAEARALFDKIITYRNRFGLFSEDVDPKTGELWGNFPQAYSMVGLINSAMNLSLSWEEAS